MYDPVSHVSMEPFPNLRRLSGLVSSLEPAFFSSRALLGLSPIYFEF